MSGLEKFYTLNPQFYESLWLSSKSPFSFLEQIKANQKLNQIEFKHRLEKAVSSWHSHLLFDEVFLENKNLENYIRWTQKSQIYPVILVSISSFPKYKKKLEKLVTQFSDRFIGLDNSEKLKQQQSKTEDFNLEFHFICENNDFSIEELSAFKNKASLVYVITKKNRNSFLKEGVLTSKAFTSEASVNGVSETSSGVSRREASISEDFLKSNFGSEDSFIKNYQNFFKKRYLYFPYKSHFKDSFLTSRQVYRFLEKNSKLSPYPVDIYDKRIPKDMDLAPLYTPFFENPDLQARSNLSAPSLPKSSFVLNSPTESLSGSSPSVSNSPTKSLVDSSIGEEIYFSVVIPCYNSGKQLLNTLRFLTQQDFPKNQYEVIVVDDGSPHPVRQSLSAFSKKNPGINVKGIYFPRVIEKIKKSARFRAGLARNLGVKHSRGKYLAFLDSDILVPSNYLTRLKKEHEQADLILVKRYHLNKNSLSLEGELKSDELFSKVKEELNSNFFQPKEETELKRVTIDSKGKKREITQSEQYIISQKQTSISSKDQNKSKKIETYIEEESYWGSFYKKGFDKVEYPWKYICSYGLSLSRKDFNEVGGFGKAFLFYGFEDTDLGYRLLKKNKKALLSDIVVLHQADTNSMTWSYPLFRQTQLFKTAKIFFYRHLDPEIYKALKVYMRQERTLSYFL